MDNETIDKLLKACSIVSKPGGMEIIFPHLTTPNMVRTIVAKLKDQFAEDKATIKNIGKVLEIVKARDPHTRQFFIDMRVIHPVKPNKNKFIVEPNYQTNGDATLVQGLKAFNSGEPL